MSSPEPNGIRFRDFEPADFLRLCELDQICFAPAIAYTPEEIAAALYQPHTFALIAERDAHVVAFVLAGRTRKLVGHVITIDVHPDCRGRGIGTRLMEMAEARLAQQGAQRAVLEVSTGNAVAIAFYRARGYAGERLLRRYYRDGSDAWLMEKAL